MPSFQERFKGKSSTVSKQGVLKSLDQPPVTGVYVQKDFASSVGSTHYNSNNNNFLASLRITQTPTDAYRSSSRNTFAPRYQNSNHESQPSIDISRTFSSYQDCSIPPARVLLQSQQLQSQSQQQQQQQQYQPQNVESTQRNLLQSRSTEHSNIKVQQPQYRYSSNCCSNEVSKTSKHRSSLGVDLYTSSLTPCSLEKSYPSYPSGFSRRDNYSGVRDFSRESLRPRVSTGIEAAKLSQDSFFTAATTTVIGGIENVQPKVLQQFATTAKKKQRTNSSILTMMDTNTMNFASCFDTKAVHSGCSSSNNNNALVLVNVNSNANNKSNPYSYNRYQQEQNYERRMAHLNSKRNSEATACSSQLSAVNRSYIPFEIPVSLETSESIGNNCATASIGQIDWNNPKLDYSLQQQQQQQPQNVLNQLPPVFMLRPRQSTRDHLSKSVLGVPKPVRAADQPLGSSQDKRRHSSSYARSRLLSRRTSKASESTAEQ